VSRGLAGPTIFFDRTFGYHLPEIFRLAGKSVEHHQKHFQDIALDEDWLQFVGERGWFVLTHDKHIRSNESERRALVDHRVGCFALSSGNLKLWDQVGVLYRAWPKMEFVMAMESRPFIFIIRPNATLEPLPIRPVPESH
jgi:hypothetical protein